MTECPIGLICEFFECERSYCQNLADPWPLPYLVNPGWMPGIGLLVSLPTHDWDCPNVEHLIIENENYNRWVETVRHFCWQGGWWDAVDLPYQFHPDGGLLVIHDRPLDESTTLSCCWDFEDGYQRYRSHWDGFMPPVPINGFKLIYGEFSGKELIEADGFFKWWTLCAGDFEGLEDEE